MNNHPIRVPELREVTQNLMDNVRTVVFQMPDGTTRSFQTTVDWLDTAPSLLDLLEASEERVEKLEKALREIASRRLRTGESDELRACHEARVAMQNIARAALGEP